MSLQNVVFWEGDFSYSDEVRPELPLGVGGRWEDPEQAARSSCRGFSRPDRKVGFGQCGEECDDPEQGRERLGHE